MICLGEEAYLSIHPAGAVIAQGRLVGEAPTFAKVLGAPLPGADGCAMDGIILKHRQGNLLCLVMPDLSGLFFLSYNEAGDVLSSAFFPMDASLGAENGGT